MKRILIAATAMSLAIAVGACHKTGANAGKDLSNPAGSAPANAVQDAAAGATGVVAGVTAPTSNEGYVSGAAIADMYEVEAGKIAEQRGKSPDVKAFGKMMVADHTKSTQMVKDALAKSGLTITPPAEMDARRKGMIDNLKQAGNSDFDLAYLHQQLAAHLEALELHKGYADHGDNAALKAAAAQIVPVVEHHLDEVKRIGGDKLKDAAPGGGSDHK